MYLPDLPEFDLDSLGKFSNPVIVKAGQSASFKMSFPPQASLEIKWFKNGSELLDGGSVKVVKESNYSRLQIKDCLRSDTGQIQIKLKNPFGSIEALSSLTVLGKNKISNLTVRKTNSLLCFKRHICTFHRQARSTSRPSRSE